MTQAGGLLGEAVLDDGDSPDLGAGTRRAALIASLLTIASTLWALFGGFKEHPLLPLAIGANAWQLVWNDPEGDVADPPTRRRCARPHVLGSRCTAMGACSQRSREISH